MHDENGIGRFALCILLRFSQRPVMNAQLRQCFARGKFEIADRKVALGRRRIICGGRETRGEETKEVRRFGLLDSCLTISLPFGLDLFDQLVLARSKL